MQIRIRLNSNIRCIEILKLEGFSVHYLPLNSNIRCIEMILEQESEE